MQSCDFVIYILSLNLHSEYGHVIGIIKKNEQASRDTSYNIKMSLFSRLNDAMVPWETARN